MHQQDSSASEWTCDHGFERDTPTLLFKLAQSNCKSPFIMESNQIARQQSYLGQDWLCHQTGLIHVHIWLCDDHSSLKWPNAVFTLVARVPTEMSVSEEYLLGAFDIGYRQASD